MSTQQSSIINTQPDRVEYEELLENFGISIPRGNAQVNGIVIPRVSTNAIYNTGDLHIYGKVKTALYLEKDLILGSGSSIITIPPSIPGGASFSVLKNATTSGSADTVIITQPIAANSTAIVNVHATAGISGGVDCASYKFHFRVKNIGGIITLSNNFEKTISLDAAMLTTEVKTAASVGGFNILVKGIAATNVLWIVKADILSQTI